MNRSARASLIVGCAVAGLTGGCREAASREAPDPAVIAARESRLDTALHDTSGSTSDPIARWNLPAVLREISGLALTGDGTLLAHGDERGVIWEIDYRHGVLLKQFTVGTPALASDLEGITRAGSRFYLLASNGRIYEFAEGGNGEHVDYKVHDTHLGKECEFEGIAFDSTANSLILACKRILKKSLDDGLLLYRWRLDDSSGDQLSTLSVPFEAAVGNNGWKELRPSDITVDPATGNYVVISAQQHALIELTPTGEVVRSQPLPKGHEQPEGVAITPDRVLIISDEAGNRSAASITLYRWR